MTEKPTTMEQLLAAAAADATLRDELLADRQAALRSRGIELNATDAAMLASVPDAQLEAMLGQLADGASVLSRIDASVRCTGIRPDELERIERSPVKGIRPGRIILTAAVGTAVVGGALSLSVTRGSRPDRPVQVTQPLQQDAAQAAPPDAGSDGDEDGGDSRR
jgi:hypothetical protein